MTLCNRHRASCGLWQMNTRPMSWVQSITLYCYNLTRFMQMYNFTNKCLCHAGCIALGHLLLQLGYIYGRRFTLILPIRSLFKFSGVWLDWEASNTVQGYLLCITLQVQDYCRCQVVFEWLYSPLSLILRPLWLGEENVEQWTKAIWEHVWLKGFLLLLQHIQILSKTLVVEWASKTGWVWFILFTMRPWLQATTHYLRTPASTW